VNLVIKPLRDEKVDFPLPDLSPGHRGIYQLRFEQEEL
jgi:hypothetical protein